MAETDFKGYDLKKLAKDLQLGAPAVGERVEWTNDRRYSTPWACTARVVDVDHDAHHVIVEMQIPGEESMTQMSWLEWARFKARPTSNWP